MDGFGISTPNKIYAALGVSPFTGSHIVYTSDPEVMIGQIMSSTDAWCFPISQI